LLNKLVRYKGLEYLEVTNNGDLLKALHDKKSKLFIIENPILKVYVIIIQLYKAKILLMVLFFNENSFIYKYRTENIAFTGFKPSAIKVLNNIEYNFNLVKFTGNIAKLTQAFDNNESIAGCAIYFSARDKTSAGITYYIIRNSISINNRAEQSGGDIYAQYTGGSVVGSIFKNK